MKSLFKTTWEWMNHKFNVNQELPMAEVISFKLPLAPAAADAVSKPSLEPAKPRARRVIQDEEPQRAAVRRQNAGSLPHIFFTGGAEVKTVLRGARLYATCPHCESTWNVRERLLRHYMLRPDGSKPLSCPSCDQPIALPSTTDLRKLS